VGGGGIAGPAVHVRREAVGRRNRMVRKRMWVHARGGGSLKHRSDCQKVGTWEVWERETGGEMGQ